MQVVIPSKTNSESVACTRRTWSHILGDLALIETATGVRRCSDHLPLLPGV